MRRRIKITIFAKLLIAFIFATIFPLILGGILILKSHSEVLEQYFQTTKSAFGKEIYVNIQNFKFQVLITLLIITVLSIFVSALISRNVSRSIRKLLEGTKAISKGNFSYRIKISSKDELGELANSFNQMAQQLEKSHAILEESKKILEIRVKARTRELEELAQVLEDKVEARTKELQERIEELERFHRLTIGRELKMVELKKKLREKEKEVEQLRKKMLK